jgi:hypothetical protein
MGFDTVQGLIAYARAAIVIVAVVAWATSNADAQKRDLSRRLFVVPALWYVRSRSPPERNAFRVSTISGAAR